MSGRKRKAGGQQADFKRIKAKVGKRAPKSQNLTETAFKAASLRVAEQAVDNVVGDSALLSTRGKSLGDLISQLGHPAAPVRHSAMKGLGNVASHQAVSALRPHLSTLIDACAKSWVDEEGDVRTTGLSVFEHLIPRFNDGTIAPFTPLLAAYIKSALHSLEPQMRVDGARALNILSRCHPSLVEPFIDTFLPAFVRLLADRKGAKVSEDVLRGLVSLLRCTKGSVKARIRSRSFYLREADLKYAAGGRSRNSMTTLTRCKPIRSYSLVTVRNLNDMYSISHLGKDQFGKAESFVRGSTYDLLIQIRDSIVDLGQESDLQGGSRGITEDQCIMLLVEAIRLIWQRGHMRMLPQAESDTIRLSEQLTSIILEWLPDQKLTLNGEEDKLLLSISICDTVLEVASSMFSPDMKTRKNAEWIETIHGYLLSRLDDDRRNETIDVLCRLALFLDKTGQYEDQLLAVLIRCQELFFQGKCTELAKSEAARKIVLLADKIIEQHHYALEGTEGALVENLRTISMQFPHYLLAWGAEYCFESELVLSSLIGIARRSRNPTSSLLLSSFRANLGEFVLASESQKEGGRDFSVFELVSVRVQRLYLQLLVLLGSPSSRTLKGLAATCANYGGASEVIPADLRDSILDSIHTVRKSLPMRDYLGFLVSSIGVPDRGKTSGQVKIGELVSIDVRKLSSFDSGLQRVAVCLRQCGSRRSIQMLFPQLRAWLDPCSSMKSSILRYRACAAILTILLHEMKAADSSASLAEIGPEIVPSIATACCQVAMFAPVSGGEGDATCELLMPFVSLLRSEARLLIPIFRNLSNSSDDEKTSVVSVAEGLQTFQRLVDGSKIIDYGVSQTLLHELQSLRTKPSNSTERQLFERLQGFLTIQVESYVK